MSYGPLRLGGKIEAFYTITNLRRVRHQLPQLNNSAENETRNVKRQAIKCLRPWTSLH